MKKQVIAFVREDLQGLRMLNREYFIQFLSDFGAGTKLRLTLENYHPQRNLNQNATMWWYLTELAEEADMELPKFRARLEEKYLRRPLLDKNGNQVVDEITGELEMYVPSTSELDKKEMGQFIEKIRQFGITYLNYELPLPDSNYKLNFQEEKKKNLKK